MQNDFLVFSGNNSCTHYKNILYIKTINKRKYLPYQKFVILWIFEHIFFLPS